MAYSGTNQYPPPSNSLWNDNPTTLNGLLQKISDSLKMLTDRYCTPLVYATFAQVLPDQQAGLVYNAPSALNDPNTPVIERITMQSTGATSIVGVYVIWQSISTAPNVGSLPPVPNYYIFPDLPPVTVPLPGKAGYSVVVANISGNGVDASVSITIGSAS